MIATEQNRRSFLLALWSIATSRILAKGVSPAQAAGRQGYVLGPTEGEHLIHFRDRGNIFIKIGSATGSDGFASGTQQVMLSAGIPIHRHLRMDEAFYVLEGGGVLTLNDVPHAFEKAEQYSSPGTRGMAFRIPIMNYSYSGLWRPLALTGFSVTPAIHLGCRQSSSLMSRSGRLLLNMARSSDSHS